MLELHILGLYGISSLYVCSWLLSDRIRSQLSLWCDTVWLRASATPSLFGVSISTLLPYSGFWYRWKSACQLWITDCGASLACLPRTVLLCHPAPLTATGHPSVEVDIQIPSESWIRTWGLCRKNNRIWKTSWQIILGMESLPKSSSVCGTESDFEDFIFLVRTA